jgi:cell pole-organizing protein PopZ
MASSPQHEPTMEEILASIRKIISEDSTESPVAAAPVAATPAPPAAVEADVLELTQELPEEPTPPPQPVRAAASAPKPESDVVFQTIEEPAVAAPAPASQDDIFSDKTRKALDDTFANIPDDEPARPAARGTSAGLGGLDGSSVEAVFERAVTNAFDPVLHQWMDKNKSDLLLAVRPLIREWMDEHFPALLEGAVRNEVERVVKARGNKR